MVPHNLAAAARLRTTASGKASASVKASQSLHATSNTATSYTAPSDTAPSWLESANLQLQLHHSEPGEPVQLCGWPGQFFRQCPAGVTSALLPAEPLFGFWLSQPLSLLQWHCLASSRLGQRLAGDRQLINALQQVLDSLQPDAATLLYSPRFALAAHLRAASARTGISLLELREIPSTATQGWFRRQTTRREREQRNALYFFRLPKPPRLSHSRRGAQGSHLERRADREGCPTKPSDGENLSAVDWLAIHLAQLVHILSVRAGGQIVQAIQSRLEARNSLTLDVRLLEAPHLTAPALAESLYQCGAVRWRTSLSQANRATATPNPGTARSSTTSAAGIIAQAEIVTSENFLFHWTRSLPLSRRRESDSSLVHLLKRPTKLLSKEIPTAERLTSIDGPLGTLFEIVSSGRILSSGRWTPDCCPVVSLTAQPLERWPELHRYRPHLGRWDFEFFGVALLRARVLELGGRPVIYGDQETRRKLAPEELPWFQQSHTRRTGTPIDWTIEQEWRVPGDIDLRRFGPEEAYLFVLNRESAELIAPLSRWPVVSFVL